MKISVIMPSYLSEYETKINNSMVIKSAKNREDSFIYAVNSFIRQSYINCELIIVSDGCNKTVELYNKHFKKYPNIKIFKIAKQDTFSGKVRQTGIEHATGDIITYLDTDDFFGENHLKMIAKQIGDYCWCYYDDIIYNKNICIKREVLPSYSRIGTSSFSHRRDVELIWKDGSGHDWTTIKEYLLHYPVVKIKNAEYYVCHLHVPVAI